MFTKPFNHISKQDAGSAGGKGASLGEMTQAGIPVPPGFVILADSFEQFLKETDLNVEIDSILHTVNHQEMHTVEYASERIQKLILEAKMLEDIASEIESEFKKLGAEFVAVRSSATAEDGAENAWAGQLDSFLNTNEETLPENVQKCWASLFTPRAVFYRFEKGLHDQKISVAVVVQKMVASEKSGIAFSVHPVTEDRNQLIIEAGFGLGEAIVSGQITPDSYVVEKEPRRIIDQNVATQERGIYKAEGGGNEWRELGEKGKEQVLTEAQILELSELIVKIENHYGFPCDIEWAYEDGKFYIVQSRPITTLAGKTEERKLFKKEDYILSFWVQGVSIFVTDIHSEAYKALEVLYIIDGGMFKQYFTKTAYERALDRGLVFYSDEYKFNNYRKGLSSHCDSFKEFFESEIKNKDSLSREMVSKFFEYTKKLCEEYAQMNFESTDKAFLYQEENPTIKKNLAGVADFKDQVRTVMNMVLFEPAGYSEQFFDILGKQFGVSPEFFGNLTQNEILSFFDGKKLDESIVSKRQNAFVENYNLDIYEREQAEPIIQEFKEEVVYSETLPGQTASKGKTIGKVKIIPVDYSNLSRVSAEIEKMQQGDILVAETTAPELMVACKKAGAIVTDMGGLMSHAAIVSREFGIPCIVGTKNASKILHDGDLVEVDAETSVVRVLERGANNTVQKFINLMAGRSLWPPLNNYTFFGQGSAYNTAKYFADYYPDLPPMHLILIAKEGESMQIIPSDTLEYCSRYIFRSYLDGSKEAVNRFRNFDEVEDHISFLYEEYTSQKISEIPTGELLGIMDSIRDRIWRLNCYIIFTIYFDKEICLDVLKNTNSSISEERLNFIWERAIHPAFESFEKAQQRSILKTIAENRSHEFRIVHARFIFTNYFGAEELEEVAKKVDDEYGTFTKDEALLKLTELDDELRKEKATFNDWLQTLSQDEQKLVWYIQRIIEYRDRRKNLFAKAYVIWWLVYEKALLEAQIDHSLITYIQFDEMMRGVEYLKSHYTEIEARKNGAALLVEFNGTITLEPLDYDKAKQQLTEFYVQSVTAGKKENEIKGQVGSPGKIQGKVCVVLNAAKSDHFKDGDILVTGMTRPEFVPIMKKASAIITDEGGITCHAAIISRELKKPCIIGTKIATQVLHDGDLVEVDADNGVVRIIEKAK